MYYYESNAPYNKVDMYDVYETQITECVKDEINTFQTPFEEWLNDNEYLPTEFPSQETKSKIINILSNDNDVFYKYYDYRKDDILGLVQSRYENYYE